MFSYRSQINMSDLENAMITIIQVFHKYSGHKCKLKKYELKNLINNELSYFITVSNTKSIMNVLHVCKA